jgi:hypothetical protein
MLVTPSVKGKIFATSFFGKVFFIKELEKVERFVLNYLIAVVSPIFNTWLIFFILLINFGWLKIQTNQRN